MEYYLAMKKNELLMCATARMNLKHVNERRQTEETKYSVIPFIRHSKNVSALLDWDPLDLIYNIALYLKFASK